MRFFSYDGFLAQAIRLVWRMFVLNLCYMLCCLTVVGFGAATSALCAVFLNDTQDERLIFRFFRELKRNLRQGTAVGAVFLAVWAVLGADLYFLLRYDFAGETLVWVGIVIVLLLSLSAASFAFPLQGHFENPVRTTLRNSVTLGAIMFIRGLLMSAVALFPAIVFFLSVEVFIRVLAFWLLLGFSMSAKLNSMIVKGAFKKTQNGETPEDG